MPEQPDAAVFEFNSIVLDYAELRTLAPEQPTEGEERPNTLTLSIKPRAQLSFAGDDDHRTAILKIELQLTTDPKWQPYRITVRYTGLFRQQSGAPSAFDEFCRTNAPAIMFPYIRETVYRLTIDARWGPVRLNPMNINAMFTLDKPVETSPSDTPPAEP